MSTLIEHIERSLRAAGSDRAHLIERAFDELERIFGISRDRVDERGNLEVTPEEFSQMRTTALQVADYDVESDSLMGFEIRVIVVNPEPMCDRTLQCQATKEHFLSCHAAPWQVAR